jgi:cytochrome oxidase Cu insertion factor (SCO1/SenC/PrrC family)
MHVQQAPQFTLEHIDGHPVSLSQYRGRTVVVALAGRGSADQMSAAIEGLRRHYDPQQLPIFSITDMSGMPRAARPMVKRKLKGIYKENVEETTAQLQAAGKPVAPGPELVIMLPDWQGTVASSFGLTDVDKEAAMVLIDAEGNMRGYGRGNQAAEQIMALFG